MSGVWQISDRRRWPWILATAAFVEVAIDRTQGIGPVADRASSTACPGRAHRDVSLVRR